MGGGAGEDTGCIIRSTNWATVVGLYGKLFLCRGKIVLNGFFFYLKAAEHRSRRCSGPGLARGFPWDTTGSGQDISTYGP